MRLMLLIHGNGVHNVKQICPANDRHSYGMIKLKDVPDFMSLPVWRDNRPGSNNTYPSARAYYAGLKCEACGKPEVERCNKCERFFCIPCHRGAHPEYDVVRDRVQQRSETGPYRRSG
jgi:hypothetical protein